MGWLKVASCGCERRPFFTLVSIVSWVPWPAPSQTLSTSSLRIVATSLSSSTTERMAGTRWGDQCKQEHPRAPQRVGQQIQERQCPIVAPWRDVLLSMSWLRGQRESHPPTLRPGARSSQGRTCREHNHRDHTSHTCCPARLASDPSYEVGGFTLHGAEFWKSAAEPPHGVPTPSTTPKGMPDMSPGPVLSFSYVGITPWGSSVLTGLSAAYLAHRSAWVASGTARVLVTRLQSCALRGREQRRPTVCCRPVTAARHCQ